MSALLEPLPLVAPDGTPIPYLRYVSAVPPPNLLAHPATVQQLVETFQRLASGLSLPLVPDYNEAAYRQVWVRPPRLYLPTTSPNQILCFDWETWIKGSGFLLERAQSQHVVDAFLERLHRTVEHGAVGAQPEFVGHAMDLEPLIGRRLVAAQLVAGARSEDLSPAPR